MRYSNQGRRELKRLANQLTFLLEKGLDRTNTRVQVLIDRIKFILRSFRFNKRFVRRAFGTALVVFGMSFSQQASAQATFIAPVSNPFGLQATYQTAAPAVADMDNDGDMDLLVAEYYGVLKYYQNTGTATAPTFAAPVTNPFGMVVTGTYLPEVTIADLDGDGDLDVMCAEYNAVTYNSDIKYFQNTGTATAPAFGAAQLNPFGTTSGYYLNAPQLADIDNDGDYDFFSVAFNNVSNATEIRYQENTGSAIAPAFGPVQLNPFGLTFPASSQYAVYLSFGDIDSDGDLDVMYGDGYSNGNFLYIENTGSATAASFGTQVTNPFGLIATNATSTGQKMNNPAILDMDNDGDLDIITGEYGGNLVYFENLFISSGPLAIANVTISTPSCSPGGDGSINVVASGGTQPIIYKIGTDSNSTGNFMNYLPGTYTIRVRDSLNTIIDSTVTLGPASPPIIDTNNFFVSNVTCNGLSDGSILAIANGGTTPYSYQLIPGPTNATGQFQSLSAGNYTIIVTDSKNCSDTIMTTVTQPPAVNLVIDSAINLSCFGSMNGAIYTTATGPGGFSYTINPFGGTQFAPGDYTGLAVGNYTITVTDLNGCSASVSQVLTQPQNTIITTISNITNVSCFGGNDGSFTATATGGALPYSYVQMPMVGTQASPGSFTNLTANNYSVTTTDANGCSNATVVTVTQPPQLVLNISSTQAATSNTATDGSITSLASGGVAAYNYSITPNSGTQAPAGTFTGLGTGNYTITVTDANNCTTTSNANVGFWPVGVNDIEKHNIKLYPNPVSDVLKLESDVEIQSLSVLDITGKVITTFNKPSNMVSLKEIPNGIYIIRVNLKNEESVYTRIVKQ